MRLTQATLAQGLTQATLAQVVAHLIGSEEVPGPSPGSSFSAGNLMRDFRLFLFSDRENKF